MLVAHGPTHAKDQRVTYLGPADPMWLILGVATDVTTLHHIRDPNHKLGCRIFARLWFPLVTGP